MTQLPAHLQNRQVRSLTERASEGMGGALPPHVSIAGNTFTFIDAAGNEQTTPHFSAVVVDMADRFNKRYYDKPYEPGSDEPPRCWSANGVTPSAEVAAPISPTCDGCAMNVRGSAVSKMSGASIKACRDEKWIAIIVPQFPQVIFRLTISPGSFQNWKAYTETLKGNGVELSFALTQFSFVPKETGVLQFQFVGWIDEPTLLAVEAANKEGKTDALVGRSDPVRAIAAPAQTATLPPPNQFQQSVQEVLPPQQTAAPFGTAPAAAMTQQPMTAAPAAAMAPAAEAPARRRRRTSAEMAAAGPAAAPQAFGQAPAAPQAPFGQAAPTAPVAAPQAPFGQPVAQPAPANQNFGIGQGQPVTPELEEMLKNMGFSRAG